MDTQEFKLHPAVSHEPISKCSFTRQRGAVFRLLCLGYTPRNIASDTSHSRNTIRNQLNTTRTRMGMMTPQQAVISAHITGFMDNEPLQAYSEESRGVTVDRISNLTPKQKTVLRYLCAGYKSEEIAGLNYNETKTITNHQLAINSELGTHTKIQAIVGAYACGWAKDELGLYVPQQQLEVKQPIDSMELLTYCANQVALTYTGPTASGSARRSPRF